MTINRFYFFLTFLVITISGNPAMGILGKEIVYIGTFIIFLIYGWFNPRELEGHDVFVLATFTFILIAHLMIFGPMVFAASIGFMIKLGIALLAVRLIPEFPRHYVSAMYILACLSLVFYIPVQLGIDLAGLLSTIRIPLGDTEIVHIGIHNFHIPDERGRNCGIFWEPGAFAGYLVLALFFLVRDGQTKTVISKQGLVLIAALLTTQSTTGYLAFIILSVYYVYKVCIVLVEDMDARLLALPLLVALLILGGLVVFKQIPFLGEKINIQVESTMAQDDVSRINRFGNFLYDLDSIAKRPLLGWSANPQTRLSTYSEIIDLISGQGNGLTGFIVKFGFVGLCLFIGIFAYNTRRLTGSTSAALFGIAIVCVLLNGEQFLGFPIFLSLMFLPQGEPRPLTAAHMTEARKL